VGAEAQLLQRCRAEGEGRLERLAFDGVGAVRQQIVGMAAVPGPRQDDEIGEGLAGRLDQLDRLLPIVQGDDQHARAIGAGLTQQVQARGVAIVYAATETAQQLDLLDIAVQDRRLETVRREQAPVTCPNRPNPAMMMSGSASSNSGSSGFTSGIAASIIDAAFS